MDNLTMYHLELSLIRSTPEDKSTAVNIAKCVMRWQLSFRYLYITVVAVPKSVYATSRDLAHP